MDAIASVGERLSSLVVSFAFKAAGLPSQHVDSRSVVVTDDRFTHATPLLEETYARLKEKVRPIAETCVVVMGGFIGSTKEGHTQRWVEGGSDYSGFIDRRGCRSGRDSDLDRRRWNADRRSTRRAAASHRVKSISFAEAAEMAYFGAKVLHPATVLPAVEKAIPVVILNRGAPKWRARALRRRRFPARIR